MMKMHGIWIKNTVLLLGMTLSGAALLAQQAVTPVPANGATSVAAEPQTATQGTYNTPMLTAEQRKQLRELRLTTRDQTAIIRHDQSLSADQKVAKLKELRASTRAQMKAVLTPAQQKMFADRVAAHKARVAEKLGLTADQQSKLKELFQSNRQQRQAVLANPSLTNEQKLAQLSQIRQSSKAQLAPILTPEQLVKFQQMRSHRRWAKRG
jgi:Spy/CpxP family protein refolding chaperone